MIASSPKRNDEAVANTGEKAADEKQESGLSEHDEIPAFLQSGPEVAADVTAKLRAMVGEMNTERSAEAPPIPAPENRTMINALNSAGLEADGREYARVFHPLIPDGTICLRDALSFRTYHTVMEGGMREPVEPETEEDVLECIRGTVGILKALLTDLRNLKVGASSEEARQIALSIAKEREIFDALLISYRGR